MMATIFPGSKQAKNPKLRKMQEKLNLRN